MTGTGEFTLRRIHRASPELLFECMTTPEHLARFWGPAGTTTPVGNIVVDLRPGGAFETTMVNDADGGTYTMRAVYAEVGRPDRLVWIEPGVEGGMRTTVVFTDLGDGRTEVVTHQTNVPAAFMTAEARAGFATSHDRFDAYLAGLTRVATSPDGTAIAYECTGDGPALILVDGALCFRAAGPMRPLAALLQDSFAVHAYDRRGRGESSDTRPYAVTREVDDLRALVTEAGGEAYVYAISSGAALAMAAAAADPRITRLALFEPPFMSEVADRRMKEYTERLGALLASGRDGDAVALFMANAGIPAEAVAGIRTQPGWAALESIAPTLAYDAEALGDGRVPRDLASAITVPALVLAGGASPDGLRGAARATADALPASAFRTLEGQTHDVAPDALAPVLAEFFGA